MLISNKEDVMIIRSRKIEEKIVLNLCDWIENCVLPKKWENDFIQNINIQNWEARVHNRPIEYKILILLTKVLATHLRFKLL